MTKEDIYELTLAAAGIREAARDAEEIRHRLKHKLASLEWFCVSMMYFVSPYLAFAYVA